MQSEPIPHFIMRMGLWLLIFIALFVLLILLITAEVPHHFLIFCLLIFVALVARYVTAFWCRLVASIHEMGRDSQVVPVDQEQEASKFRDAEDLHPWAEANGFQWAGGYVTRQGYECFNATWLHKHAPRTLTIRRYPGGFDEWEFATTFIDRVVLLTSNRKESLFLPSPPLEFAQAFEGRSLDELFDEHVAAENFVMSHENVRMAEGASEDSNAMALRRIAYVKSLPLWQLRCLSWYLRMGRRAGRSIREQLTPS